jgi:hypothetical protein
MKCDQCKQPVQSGEERELNDQILCEDCYMTALSPQKSCFKCGQGLVSLACLRKWGKRDPKNGN